MRRAFCPNVGNTFNHVRSATYLSSFRALALVWAKPPRLCRAVDFLLLSIDIPKGKLFVHGLLEHIVVGKLPLVSGAYFT